MSRNPALAFLVVLLGCVAAPARATACPELPAAEAELSDYVFTGTVLAVVPIPAGAFVLFRVTRHWSSSTTPLLFVVAPRRLFESGRGYLVFARSGVLAPATSKCLPNAELPLLVPRGGGHEPELCPWLGALAMLGALGAAIALIRVRRRHARDSGFR